MPHSFLRAAVAATTAIAALAATPPASAMYYHAVSPGMACHAANPGATLIISSNHYLTNNNSTAQYVMCYLPIIDAVADGQQLAYLGVEISTFTGGTVTCTAQTGAYLAATNMVHASASRTKTMSGSDIGSLHWDAGTLNRSSSSDSLTLNCRMDPGTRLGLISYADQ
jgi:hypothetical protein